MDKEGPSIKLIASYELPRNWTLNIFIKKVDPDNYQDTDTLMGIKKKGFHKKQNAIGRKEGTKPNCTGRQRGLPNNVYGLLTVSEIPIFRTVKNSRVFYIKN